MALPVLNPAVHDLRDWLVMGLVTIAWVAATVFLFKYHTEMDFATWATFSATITGVYHFLCVHDDKVPDCEHRE